MDLGLSQILPFERDPGDRNRTSPFAFTGNRFEFRAVGSSQSVSGPLVAMNTILADSLDWIADKLEVELADGQERSCEAVAAVLKELMELHGNVIFGGDGYSAEWHTAAVEERGLRNIPTTADALPAFLDDVGHRTVRTYRGAVAVELESRYEVYAEQYILSIDVEAKHDRRAREDGAVPGGDVVRVRSRLCASAAQPDGRRARDTIGARPSPRTPTPFWRLSPNSKRRWNPADFESTEAHMQYCAGTFAASWTRSGCTATRSKPRSTTSTGRCRSIGRCCSSSDPAICQLTTPRFGTSNLGVVSPAFHRRLGVSRG